MVHLAVVALAATPPETPPTAPTCPEPPLTSSLLLAHWVATALQSHGLTGKEGVQGRGGGWQYGHVCDGSEAWWLTELWTMEAGLYGTSEGGGGLLAEHARISTTHKALPTTPHMDAASVCVFAHDARA